MSDVKRYYRNDASPSGMREDISGPWVKATDYLYLARKLDAVERARYVEHAARRSMQHALMSLVRQHVGAELDTALAEVGGSPPTAGGERPDADTESQK